jgi:Icc-related predicted phosphoesterase
LRKECEFMAKTRFLFATDLHGSETVWRKFLNSAKYFQLDALVISGDMTSKTITPLIRRQDGDFDATLLDEKHVLKESELSEFEKKLRLLGYIPYRTTPEEADHIGSDENYREKVFEAQQLTVVKFWLSLIPDRVPKSCRVILTPGNDDTFAIDELIRADPNVIYGEEEVVHLDEEHEVACCGWTTPTPWHTPREATEEELEKKLERTVSHVTNFRTAVFCFHCPPFNSVIDTATKLTEDLRPVYSQGRPVEIPAGSTAVRKIIEKYQPLISLHGHIHESSGFIKIGRTQCLNPGSEYGEGILRAHLVELDGEKIKKLQRIEA